MAALADYAIEATDDRLAARNVLILAAAQALAGGNNIVVVATGGIAGSMLAPNPVLATLPISVMVLGMWIGTLPVGMLAEALGLPNCSPGRIWLNRPAPSSPPAY